MDGKTEAAQLRAGIEQILARYDDPAEPHNTIGGFPRGELAWVMARMLRELLAEESNDTRK